MTLRHMKIFLALCEHDYNTTRAAEALHMTQPAVSLALRELEAHYGVVLFDRSGRRLCIPAAGERFARTGQRGHQRPGHCGAALPHGVRPFGARAGVRRYCGGAGVPPEIPDRLSPGQISDRTGPGFYCPVPQF